jgi:hypothetical protein
MTASPVRVDACVEADVGAVVAGDDGARVVAQVDGLGAWLLSLELVEVRLDLDLLEAVLRVARRPAADDAFSRSFPALQRGGRLSCILLSLMA